MGRSQLKHRAPRGRGRGSGESARGGRGATNPTGGDGGKQRSGGRALGSNASRYEERSEYQEGGTDDHDDLTADAGAATTTTTTRRQFFAGEQNYRDMGDTKESYFRTTAMQRWEADDDDDDTETQVAASTVGVMDFAWIAEQLDAVEPSLRYQIDPKYCIDFAFEQPVNGEHREPEVAEATAIASGSLPEPTAPQADIAPTRVPPASALDNLLALSSAVATQTAATGSAVAPVGISSAPVVTASTVPDVDAQENLEDWLDDVLDM